MMVNNYFTFAVLASFKWLVLWDLSTWKAFVLGNLFAILYFFGASAKCTLDSPRARIGWKNPIIAQGCQTDLSHHLPSINQKFNCHWVIEDHYTALTNGWGMMGLVDFVFGDGFDRFHLDECWAYIGSWKQLQYSHTKSGYQKRDTIINSLKCWFLHVDSCHEVSEL